MGSGGGAKGGSSNNTTGASNQESQLATQLFQETEPGRKELLNQGLEALKTGGTSASIPMVQRAVESSKNSMSDALRQTDDSMAQSGLSGTPYAKSVDATALMSGGLQTNQAANAVGQWFVQNMPNWLSGNQSTAAGLLGNAGSSEASVQNTNTNAATSKGNVYSQALTPKAPQCCFIFLAAEGPLSPVVRAYRDSHMTTRNRRGYCRLSDVLVPMMQDFPPIRWLVRGLMTLPMIAYGNYHYGHNSYGFLFKPFVWSWMTVFNWLGDVPPYTRKGTEEVV